jgi:predicted NUDIX family phosphoesterase
MSYENMPLSELIKIIYTTEPGTNEYFSIRTEIVEKLKIERNNYEQIICCRSDIVLKGNSKFHGISNICEYGDHFTTNYFSDCRTFLENHYFFVKYKLEVEYDPMYKQLCVACFITDGKSIILLDNKAGRLKNKICLIQGHVSFTPEIYVQSEIKALYTNLIRELNEELKIENPELLEISNEPSYIINTSNNFTSLEHVGVIYKIVTTDCDELLKTISSGEPNKHDIVCFYINNDLYNNPRLDDWPKFLLDKLLEVK